jgi:hypothetical protein
MLGSERYETQSKSSHVLIIYELAVLMTLHHRSKGKKIPYHRRVCVLRQFNPIKENLFPQQDKKFFPFIEAEGSSQCSQKPAFGVCSDLD